MSGVRELCRAAFVIGRRDFTATVFSRSFVLFLIAPLFPVLFGVGFAMLSSGSGGGGGGGPSRLAVIAPDATVADLRAARARLAAADGALPELVAGAAPAGASAGAAVLDMRGRPVLRGPAALIDRWQGPATLLIDEAARTAALARSGTTPNPVNLRLQPIDRPADASDRSGLARGAQTALFALTIILASMLLSNMVEEKSNKVIEVLAAAVPVRAIFLGKLFAMLAISLVGVATWGTAAATAAAALLPADAVPAAPAIGWPGFAALAVAYFTMNYLLLGALFLGIGSHAGSVREVQVMSMPITMAQLVIFGLASTAVADPGGVAARVAGLFPWSSPLTMLAVAAQSDRLWLHPLALAWQIGWVVVTITVSAALFRRNVLKSRGPSSPRRWLPGRRAAG